MDHIQRKFNLYPAKERSGLICPLCRALLEPLKLSKDENGWQTCWWVCRNTIDKKCTFPGEVPPDVFWIKRSPEDIAEGYVPPPNFEALPPKLRHFYPKIFPRYHSAPATVSGSGSVATPTQLSTVADEPCLRTQDNSLNSEITFCGSSTIAGEEQDDSIIIDSASQAKTIIGGSDSFGTGTSGSSGSVARLGAGTGVVPTASTSLKRAATSDQAKEKQKTFNEELMQMLQNGTLSSDQLLEIAGRLKEIENNTPPIKKRKEDLLSRDEYNDGILSHIPEVSREDVAQVIKQKSLTEKFLMNRQARLAGSGTEILKNIGVHGRPAPESNKWREDTMKQVNLVLNKARRETKKAIEKHQGTRENSKWLVKCRPSPVVNNPSASSSNNEAELRKKRQEEMEIAEANKKVAALIHNTYRSVLENKRDAIKQKLEARRLREQEESEQAVLRIKKEEQESQRIRTESFTMYDDLAATSQGFVTNYAPDPCGYQDDLFEDLGNYL